LPNHPRWVANAGTSDDRERLFSLRCFAHEGEEHEVNDFSENRHISSFNDEVAARRKGDPLRQQQKATERKILELYCQSKQLEWERECQAEQRKKYEARQKLAIDRERHETRRRRDVARGR